MSSKLQPHSDLILSMLLSNSTYKKVVEALSEQGCTTSLTNLNDWVKRRHKRIVSRSHLVNPQVDQLRSVELIPATSEKVGIKTTQLDISTVKDRSNGRVKINSTVNESSLYIEQSPPTSEKKIVLPPAADYRTLHVRGPVVSDRLKALDDLIATEKLANPKSKGFVYTQEMVEMIKRSKV